MDTHMYVHMPTYCTCGDLPCHLQCYILVQLTIGQMKDKAQLVEFERGQAHVERYTQEKHEPQRLNLQRLGQVSYAKA